MYESSSHDSTKLSREKPKKSRGRSTRGASCTHLFSSLSCFFTISQSLNLNLMFIYLKISSIFDMFISWLNRALNVIIFFCDLHIFFSYSPSRALNSPRQNLTHHLSHPTQHSHTNTQTTTEKKKPQEEQIVRKTRFVQGGDRGDSRSVQSFRYGRIRIHRPARIEKRHAISWI